MLNKDKSSISGTYGPKPNSKAGKFNLHSNYFDEEGSEY